jgi:hypothetical protein
MQLHAPATLPPRKVPLTPIGLDARWALEPVWMLWRRKKKSCSAGIRTRAVQSAAYHFAN